MNMKIKYGKKMMIQFITIKIMKKREKEEEL